MYMYVVYIKKEDSYKLTEIARIICLKNDLSKFSKKAYF